MACSKHPTKPDTLNDSVLGKDETHGVRHIHQNVIETIFKALPTEPSERKKEQDKRRKFKEKIMSKYRGKLIVDSSYISADGREIQTYTNTILVTEQYDWWQEKVEEEYGQKYLQKNKDLSSGHQLVFTDGDNAKVLTFSFYPARNKIMVQGSHDDLNKWIDLFHKLTSSSDQHPPPGKNDEKDSLACSDKASDEQGSGIEEQASHGTKTACELLGDNEWHSPNPDEDPIKQSNSQEVSENHDSSTITEDDKLSDVLPSDDEWQDAIELHSTEISAEDNEALENTLTDNSPSSPNVVHRASLNKRRRSSKVTVRRRSMAAWDSLQVIRVRHRLEALEGIISGLQGGVLKLVDAIHHYTDNTEKTINEQAKNVIDKLTVRTGNGGQDKCTQDHTTLTKLVENSQRTITEKIQSINTKISCMDHTVSKSDATNKINSMNDKLEKIYSLSREIHKACEGVPQSVSNTESKLNETQMKTEIANKSTLDQLKTVVHKIDRLAEMNDGQHSQIEHKLDVSIQAATQPASGIEKDANHTDKKPSETHPNDVTRTNQSARPKERGNEAGTDTTSRDIHTTERRPHNVPKQQERRTLLVGDSTTKLLDKRVLLKSETISKCRATTINDANAKISSGGPHEMDKVVFCVGLNDLRNGKSVQQIEKDMRYLIEETMYRHPHSTIYVCSILPVNCREVTSNEILSANKQLRALERLYNSVQYIDTCTEFLNHDTPWTLFDKDGIHPNTRGNITMVSIIRKKLQSSHRQPRTWSRKLANTVDLSYADSVAGNANLRVDKTNTPGLSERHGSSISNTRQASAETIEHQLRDFNQQKEEMASKRDINQTREHSEVNCMHNGPSPHGQLPLGPPWGYMGIGQYSRANRYAGQFPQPALNPHWYPFVAPELSKYGLPYCF